MAFYDDNKAGASVGRGSSLQKAIEGHGGLKRVQLFKPRVDCLNSSRQYCYNHLNQTDCEANGNNMPDMELDFNHNIVEKANLAAKETDESVDKDLDHCSVCNRPPKLIVCMACGHTLKGRVLSRCPTHPSIVHLMDIESCPSCKGLKIKEVN